MNKKCALVIALSAILLVGCGGDEEAMPPNNPSNGDEVQYESDDTGPRNDENQEVDENSEVKPRENDDEIIGDDEFDMPDTQEQKEEETDLNK